MAILLSVWTWQIPDVVRAVRCRVGLRRQPFRGHVRPGELPRPLRARLSEDQSGPAGVVAREEFPDALGRPAAPHRLLHCKRRRTQSSTWSRRNDRGIAVPATQRESTLKSSSVNESLNEIAIPVLGQKSRS